MTTASELTKNAYREGNLIDLVTDLTTDQETEALGLLNRFIESLFGFELGEFFFDWPVVPAATAPVPARFPVNPLPRALPSNVFPYPPPNVRILMSMVGELTIYMPQDPEDGGRMLFINVGDPDTFSLTIQGNGRLIEGEASITGTPAELNGKLLFYRADLSNWISIEPLTATDESPLPGVYDDLLQLGTFLRLAPRMGRGVSEESAVMYKRLLKRCKTQYKQFMPMPKEAPNQFFLPAADMDRRGFTFGSSLF